MERVELMEHAEHVEHMEHVERAEQWNTALRCQDPVSVRYIAPAGQLCKTPMHSWYKDYGHQGAH